MKENFSSDELRWMMPGARDATYPLSDFLCLSHFGNYLAGIAFLHICTNTNSSDRGWLSLPVVSAPILPAACIIG